MVRTDPTRFLTPQKVDVGELCGALINAESESRVTRLLRDHGLHDDLDSWENYGNVENNIGTIENQQSDALSALTEKIINAVDAVLVRGCLEAGVDPESAAAPKDTCAAAERFFGVPDGHIPKIIDHRTKQRLSESIQLVASGSRRNPAFSVIDCGEGQHPDAFPATFLSLNKSNKNRIPFTQGRFNMGGTGALAYCGDMKYQLIVSRRHMGICDHPGDNPWGFTLVRRRRPGPGEKVAVYEYLAPGGRVPRFRADTLPVLPQHSDPRGGDLESGTYIKLYNYRISPRSLVTAGLYRHLNQRLFMLPLPVRIHEGRDYSIGGSRYSLLEGMRARLEDRTFRDEVLEKPDFPVTSQLRVSSSNRVNVTIWLLRSDVTVQDWIPRANEAIAFTINGQQHAGWSRQFFSRNAVKKDYLCEHLLVEVDCSTLQSDLISDMFMPSRDRMRDTNVVKDLQRKLEQLLSSDRVLKKHNELRRNERRRGVRDDDKQAEEILQELVKASPEIANLLGGKGSLSDPFRRGRDNTKPFEGRRFPTFLELRTPRSGEVSLPTNTYRQIILETDAENDYFVRLHEPGELLLEPAHWVQSHHLRNGRLTIQVEVPPDMRVGDCTELRINLTTPEVPGGYLARCVDILVVEPERTKKRRRGRRSDETRGLAVPSFIPVYRDQWDEFDWDRHAVADVRASDEGTDIFINMDNVHLHRILGKKEMRGKEKALRRLFRIGIGTVVFAMHNRVSEGDNCVVSDEAYDIIKDTLALSWLPTIVNLTELVSL